jgi:hypothetical protein
MQIGDIFLYASDRPTTERLKYCAADWQSVFGPDAPVQLQTYRAVEHSQIRQPRGPACYHQAAPRGKLTPIHRRLRPDYFCPTGSPSRTKERRSKPSLSFSGMRKKQTTVRAQTKWNWNGCPKKVQRYLRECQICQYYKSYQYGHKASRHPAKYGYCNAEDHSTTLTVTAMAQT